MLTRQHRHRLNVKVMVDISIIAIIFMLVCYFLLANNINGGYTWEWPRLWKYFLWRGEDGTLHSGLLIRGLANTLRIGFWSLLLAWAIGICFGLMRMSRFLFLRLLAGSYVGVVRNIPPLIIIFVVHFFLGMLLEPLIPWQSLSDGLNKIPLLCYFIPAGNISFFFSAVIALGVYEGAYATEIVRAGMESVPKGQWEAAASLGLSRSVTIISVITPQAFRLMLPPLVSQSVSLVKDSSIVSTISVAELTFQGREIMNTTYMVFELWISITVMYLMVSLIISGLGHYLEKRSKWKPV
ncbi:amino acid ABC transporter permease [Desulfovibrio sp. OttesenSCG-928-F07]|nr:amino acid ABC transporter permease [Desulfovibrio sp. OttesenSCG-928-F07]